MLKLDDVENTVGDDDLGGAPNTADQSFWSNGKPGERSMYFVVWPAHVGERPVRIRISTEELGRISGDSFVINSTKITAALRTYRARIEERANETLELHPDPDEITLDIGSLDEAGKTSKAATGS